MHANAYLLHCTCPLKEATNLKRSCWVFVRTFSSCLRPCLKLMPGDSYPKLNAMKSSWLSTSRRWPEIATALCWCVTPRRVHKKICFKLCICFHGLTPASNHYKIILQYRCRGLFRVCTHTKQRNVTLRGSRYCSLTQPSIHSAQKAPHIFIRLCLLEH